MEVVGDNKCYTLFKEAFMKNILELKFGFSDAENYRRRENKELFNKVFLRNRHLDTLCDPGTSFLIGEKGTGKTAYAVFLSNNLYKDTQSSLSYIRETDYQKFITLKKQKQLDLSDYANIWKVILLLLISEQVKRFGGEPEFWKKFVKFNAVQQAIDEYYHRAFSPEIMTALQFVQEAKIAAELLAKYATVGSEVKEKTVFSESRFQINLFYIQQQFESALRQVHLSHDHILFIDGIDIRPNSIPYIDYLECIKGLANAVWELNNDFFPSIKGKKGRLRTILLIRPDIFESLGLQNQNGKIRDNSVFLDWRTNDKDHKTSDLFQVVDHLIASQQEGDPLELGKAWDWYFPWEGSSVDFIHWSLHRPRDIVSMLVILRDLMGERCQNLAQFSRQNLSDTEFVRRYSDYLLGEVKDHLTFYYGDADYELFLQFFEFLKGKIKFTFVEYSKAFDEFRRTIGLSNDQMPKFMATRSTFLQFLYNLNIISYTEQSLTGEKYTRWCFRERSFANISPKVKEGVDYQIFIGFSKALNVGQELR